MTWRGAANAARWSVMALLVAGTLNLARPVSAQAEYERVLAGVALNSRSSSVLAKYGNPNEVIIGEVGVRATGPVAGNAAGPGGGEAGFPGAPGGFPGAGAPSGFPGAPGAPSGFGGAPSGFGGAGGRAGTFGGASLGGPPSGFTRGIGAGGAGGAGLAAPGGGGNPYAQYGAGGGAAAFGGGAQGGGFGRPGDDEGGFPGAPSGFGGGFGAGGVATGGGVGQFGQTISTLARQQEVTWIYNRKVGNNLVSYEFLIGPDGNVIQIRVSGYSGGNSRTRRGIALGDTYKQVVQKYGYPEEHYQVGRVLVASYRNKFHAQFQFMSDQPNANPMSAGNKVVAITIATVE